MLSIRTTKQAHQATAVGALQTLLTECETKLSHLHKGASNPELLAWLRTLPDSVSATHKQADANFHVSKTEFTNHLHYLRVEAEFDDLKKIIYRLIKSKPAKLTEQDKKVLREKQEIILGKKFIESASVTKLDHATLTITSTRSDSSILSSSDLSTETLSGSEVIHVKKQATVTVLYIDGNWLTDHAPVPDNEAPTTNTVDKLAAVAITTLTSGTSSAPAHELSVSMSTPSTAVSPISTPKTATSPAGFRVATTLLNPKRSNILVEQVKPSRFCCWW